MFKVENEIKSQLDYLAVKNNSKKCIFMFHGYGASMMDLYGLAEHIDRNKEYDWYFPNGHLDLGQMGMGMMSRAWFPIDVAALELAMQSGKHRDFEDVYTAEFELALNKSKTFITEISKNYDDVVIGGFSQGSMITTHLVTDKNIDSKKAILFSSTLIGKNQLEHNLRNKKISFLQSHGKNDPILGFEQAQNLYELLKQNNCDGEFIEFYGAHEIPSHVLEKTCEFLGLSS